MRCPVTDRQASLFESTDLVSHQLTSARELSHGWVAWCSCGWSSSPRMRAPFAYREWRQHLAATPRVQALAEVVRRPGRFGHE